MGSRSLPFMTSTLRTGRRGLYCVYVDQTMYMTQTSDSR